jgi:hypothetical protein
MKDLRDLKAEPWQLVERSVDNFWAGPAEESLHTYQTQWTDQLVLESQIPQEIVNLMCIINNCKSFHTGE